MPALTAHLSAGSNGQVYTVNVTTESAFLTSTLPRLDQFAGEWNRTMRWPRAYTLIDTDGARIVGDAHWELVDGIHWQLFETLTRNTLSTAFNLFTELAAASLTPTAEELETWLHRTR